MTTKIIRPNEGKGSKWLFGPGELEKEGYFYMPFKNE